MQLEHFVSSFERAFPRQQHDHISTLFEDSFVRSHFDMCFDVEGMTSVKKQFLLKLAFACLDENECYFEVGTYQGKSLISAVKDNPPRPTYACDNFSEFTGSNSLDRLKTNLNRYGLLDKIQLFDSDFRRIMTPSHIKCPVGCYFYDGAHDLDSQYQGIRLVEPLLSDHALVIVDDWRLAPESGSYAKEGTLRAIQESSRRWEMLYELPARFNGDQAMWWNGVGVLTSSKS